MAQSFIRNVDGTFDIFNVPGVELGDTFATSINNNGDIAGNFNDGSSGNNGFIRHPDGSFETYSIDGAEFLGFTCINNSGVVSGKYGNWDGTYHGFLRAADGTITTVDAPGAGTAPYHGTQVAYRSLDDDGNMAGIFTNDTPPGIHYFIRHPDGSFDVFDVSTNYGQLSINTHANTAIGWYFDVDGNQHGYLNTPITQLVSGGTYGPTDLYPNDPQTGFLRNSDDSIIYYQAPDADLGNGSGTVPTDLNGPNGPTPPPPPTNCFLVDFPIVGPFYDPTGKVLNNGSISIRLVFDCNCPCADYQITGNNHTIIPLDVNGMAPNSPAIQIRPNDQLKPDGSYYIIQVYSESGQLVLGPKTLVVTS